MRDRVHRRESRGAKGQSMVELALTLPVLLIIFLGLIELAILLRAHLVVVNANREAARFAARGTFTDEQIAERAIFSIRTAPDNALLPIEMTGPDANTQILVTRFSVPYLASEPATWQAAYITGTLGLNSQIDPQAMANQFKAQNDQFNDDLIASQPDAVRTMQDVVVVEIFYHHYEVLHAPLVEWVFPDPMVVYSRTVMRIGASRVF